MGSRNRAGSGADSLGSERALERTLWAHGTERALERTLWAHGTERALERAPPPWEEPVWNASCP